MKKITIILTIAALALQANAYTIKDKVRVTHTEPIYKTVTIKIPYQECWDEKVPVRYQRENYHNSSNQVGTLIGGVAGGIIGNQVGRGRGRTAATIGGALIGTIVGNNLSNRNNNRRDSYVRYETQQKCTTKYTYNTQEKFIGYKNIGHYKGQKIEKISNHKLKFIPIQTTIHY